MWVYSPLARAARKGCVSPISKQDNRKIQTTKRLLLAAIAVIGLIGWLGTPAVSAPSGTPTKVQIDRLIAKSSKPDYDKDVLVPLHQAQKEAAQKEADERERQRIAAEQQRQLEREHVGQPAQVSVAPIVQGGCMDWMNQAGITDVTNAYQLIMSESGCNPSSVNSKSGACGIGQQLPCGKWPHAWNDPIGGILDMQSYVIGRYGSWANAWSFHVANGYY